MERAGPLSHEGAESAPFPPRRHLLVDLSLTNRII